jgi:hypothetical protein
MRSGRRIAGVPIGAAGTSVPSVEAYSLRPRRVAAHRHRINIYSKEAQDNGNRQRNPIASSGSHCF